MENLRLHKKNSPHTRRMTRRSTGKGGETAKFATHVRARIQQTQSFFLMPRKEDPEATRQATGRQSNGRSLSSASPCLKGQSEGEDKYSSRFLWAGQLVTTNRERKKGKRSGAVLKRNVKTRNTLVGKDATRKKGGLEKQYVGQPKGRNNLNEVFWVWLFNSLPVVPNRKMESSQPLIDNEGQGSHLRKKGGLAHDYKTSGGRCQGEMR